MPQALSDAEAAQLLKSLTLPPLPQSLAEFRQARAAGADLADMSDLIGRDLSLAAAVLKIANSPAFASRQLNNLQDAVMVLGADNLDMVVTSVTLKAAIPLAPILRAFWDDATQIAAIASHLARRWDLIKPEQAYLFCLFRDCGIPVLTQRFPAYIATLARAMEDPANFIRIEMDSRSTSHVVVGYLLARSWFMPSAMNEAILHHHDFDQLGDDHLLESESARLIALARLAEYLLYSRLRRDADPHWPHIQAAVLAELGFDISLMSELTEVATEALK
ncbi:HDOD domain-containing protein [Chitinimonas sp. JJ19]|uniref:HDOD domain-containing protein n=1 Tax=Chitinimonas sp. JJ19 TaxID=3109352 RepID=UPI001A510CC1|nr:HDOD domain-containing protein [Chitinimonas sp.]